VRGIRLVVAAGLSLSALVGCGDGEKSGDRGLDGRAAVAALVAQSGFAGEMAKAYETALRACGAQPRSEFVEESVEVAADADDAAIARGYARGWPPRKREAVVAGCRRGLAVVPDEPAPSVPEARRLWGREFAAISVAAAQGMASPPIEHADEIRIGFSPELEHSLYWSGLCNGHGGRVRITATQLKVRNAGGTLVGCFENREEEDAWLSAFIEAGPEWSLDDGLLTLRSDSAVIELEPSGGGR
jgi:hypothetical protein